jgi:D-alanyl-D-alanine dipeptidase
LEVDISLSFDPSRPVSGRRGSQDTGLDGCTQVQSAAYLSGKIRQTPLRMSSAPFPKSFAVLTMLLVGLLCTCAPSPGAPPEIQAGFPMDTLPTPTLPPPAPIDYDTTEWMEIVRHDPTILLDIRYATDSNFMNRVIYDCGRCFYRPKVGEALLRVQASLREQGLGLKMFDCYRPGPYQQRLWDVLPDPRYVANPKRGSLHSRGAAADLTLVRLADSTELNMGTGYDYFGEAAYTTTITLPDSVLANRKRFQEAMIAEGFLTIRTEWWHFNFSGPRYPLSEWVWPCTN